MNIFFLDKCPVAAANMHADGHINKMISESAQMLSTAYRMAVGTPTEVYVTSAKGNRRLKTEWLLPDDTVTESGDLIRGDVMLTTHANHPCNIWLRESIHNRAWLDTLVSWLHDIWLNKFDKKPHASMKALQAIPMWFCLGSTAEITKPAKAMPLQYVQYSPGDLIDGTVQSYRQFYIHDKIRKWQADSRPHIQRYASYTNRPKPDWLVECAPIC